MSENTAAERSMVRAAVRLIEIKYRNWIMNHSNYRFLATASNEDFDKRIRFLDKAHFDLLQHKYIGGQIEGCIVAGFCTYRDGPAVMLINRMHAGNNTVVHELLHFFTHDNFRLGVSGAVNEGVTEYFTRKTLGRIDNDDDRSLFGTGRQSYAKELRDVEGMRNLAKTVMTPMLAQQMQAKHTTPWAAAYPSQSPGRFAGKSPSPSNVRASEKETAGTKDFTKRAYFRGEKRMIDLLLNEDTVLDE